jgi:hypothetical protein
MEAGKGLIFPAYFGSNKTDELLEAGHLDASGAVQRLQVRRSIARLRAQIGALSDLNLSFTGHSKYYK